MTDFKQYPYIQAWSDGSNHMSVGYIELDQNGEVVSIIELSEQVSLVGIGQLLELEHDMQIAIDCVGGGYLRLFTKKLNRSIRWSDEEFPASDMKIVYGEPMEEINAKKD